MRYYSSHWIKAHWGVFDTQGNRDVPYATMDTEEIAINVAAALNLDASLRTPGKVTLAPPGHHGMRRVQRVLADEVLQGWYHHEITPYLHYQGGLLFTVERDDGTCSFWPVEDTVFLDPYAPEPADAPAPDA